jgi:hypothetical protein
MAALNIYSATLAVDLTAAVGEEFLIPENCYGLVLQNTFVRAAGGTTIDVWVQSSIDDTNWVDMVCFKDTTASARKVASVSADNVMAGLAPVVALDGILGDNLILDGWIGTKLRVKVTTTGTYSGASSLNVHCKFLTKTNR